jgi:hypothetical protein
VLLNKLFLFLKERSLELLDPFDYSLMVKLVLSLVKDWAEEGKKVLTVECELDLKVFSEVGVIFKWEN